jgi:putative ABC transport system substrate-binding protein
VAFITLDPGEHASVILRPLRDLGFIEGANLTFVHRSAEGDPNRLRALAEELVRAKPDVIVAGWGTLAPQAAKAATATIPIVLTSVGDPVGAGLVQNLAKPGANVTGLSGQSTEFKGKQLELLREIVPDLRVLGVILNPDTPFSSLALKELRAAAEETGTRLELLEVTAPNVFSAAGMDALVAKGATSLFVLEDPLTITIRDRVVEEANRLRLPTMTGQRDYVTAGALISYGSDRSYKYRRAAEYVEKILKGASPGDLPLEQPAKFYIAVNIKTARALGLTLPSSLLVRADEVIE